MTFGWPDFKGSRNRGADALPRALQSTVGSNPESDFTSLKGGLTDVGIT